MTEESLARVKKLLLLAAEYIREDPYVCTLRYDDAECDGFCLADDCEAMAEDMDIEAEPR